MVGEDPAAGRCCAFVCIKEKWWHYCVIVRETRKEENDITVYYK
jgi:hypothetical protein